MGSFEGIGQDALFLLAQNRFENSRAFYEAHKSRIRAEVIEPLYRLIGDLTPDALRMNPAMITEPQRALCRVRRDTRFTRDKSFYRENLWFFFRHQKNELPTPGFWFEISPSGYNYGCGIFSAPPAFLEFWRRSLLADEKGFLRAARAVRTGGYEHLGERYRRPKIPDAPKALREWLDLKEIYVERVRNSILPLADGPAITAEVSASMRELTPFYRYLLRLTQTFSAQSGPQLRT